MGIRNLTPAELHSRFLYLLENESEEIEHKLLDASPEIRALAELWFLRGFKAGEFRFREVGEAAWEETQEMKGCEGQ